MRLCEALLQRGVFAQGIRPPTVAPGTSRLRLTVMASHTADELREAARAIGATARELDIDVAAAGLRDPESVGEEGVLGDLERQVSTLAPAGSSAYASIEPGRDSPRLKGPFDGERDIVIHRAA